MNSSTAWRAISLSGVPWRFRDGRRLNQSDKIAAKILVLVCPSAWLCMVSHLTWKGDRFSSMNFSISLSPRLKRGLTLDMVTGPTQVCSHKGSFKDRQVHVSFRNLGGFRHWHRGFAEWTLKKCLSRKEDRKSISPKPPLAGLFYVIWSIFTHECFAVLRTRLAAKENQTAFAHDRMTA